MIYFIIAIFPQIQSGRFVIDVVNEKQDVEKIYKASDNLCTALQIINHIQDCKKDFKLLKGFISQILCSKNIL